MVSIDDMVAGAVGGLAGGLVMSAVMMGKQTGTIETPLPFKIERERKARAGLTEHAAQARVGIGHG